MYGYHPYMAMANRNKRLEIRLSEIEKRQLERLTEIEGKTASEIVRWLISSRYRNATLAKPNWSGR
jgi:uncharacterized protein (DUF1778 family)